MSSGEYGYICYKIEDFARELQIKNNPKRVFFKKVLELVAEISHDIEWVDSGDYSEGRENEKIDELFDLFTVDNDKILKSVMFDELMKKYEELKDNL